MRLSLRHGNRQAMGWKRFAVVHVVHAVEVEALAAVDLQNHLVGQFHPGLVVANRRGRHQGAVFQSTAVTSIKATLSLP